MIFSIERDRIFLMLFYTTLSFDQAILKVFFFAFRGPQMSKSKLFFVYSNGDVFILG